MAWPHTWLFQPETWVSFSTLIFIQSAANPVCKVSIQTNSWISPLLLSPFAVDVCPSWSPIWIISTSLCLVFLLPVFIYLDLSPECPSKLKNLILSFQTCHRPFQWLTMDPQVKPELLTLVCKTSHDLTLVIHPADLLLCPTSSSITTHAKSFARLRVQSAFCSLTQTPLFKSWKRGLWNWKEEAKAIRGS